MINWINRSRIKAKQKKQIKSAARYFWVFGIIDLKIEVENNRLESKYDEE